jgi:DNA-binding NtrC family response regulator
LTEPDAVSAPLGSTEAQVHHRTARSPDRDLPVRVLVVDDDSLVRSVLGDALAEAGYEVEAVGDGQTALDFLASRDVEVVLLDLNMPKVSGLNVLAALPSLHTEAQVIVLTAFGTVEAAVDAMKAGAYDFLRKPFQEAELLLVVDRAVQELRMRRELARMRRIARDTGLAGIIGKAPSMQRVFRLVERVAPTRASVLVSGETGTGKELVARAVHELSPRSNKPFVAVNCSALPASLLEAELFGHTKGSFTGAVQSRRGLIEEAAGGTLFLDEISTLTEDMQVKLLRVLQDRRVQRIGSNSPVPVDFRLVVATNTDLAGLVSDGRFREDLFFRLDVFPIVVPPLRQRREDIPLLATHFLARFGDEHGLEPPRLAPATLSRMSAYDWPGNVRELENLVERSVITHAGRESFPFDLPHQAPHNAAATLLGQAIDEEWTLDRLEREYLLATLAGNHWQQGAGAKILGINRRTIYRKLKRYREDGHLPDVDID